ncbi:JAB domain-containing protein [Bacillus infantis]
MKSAILSNAASIIVGHNPSGKAEPSKEYIEVTKRLVEAAKSLA